MEKEKFEEVSDKDLEEVSGGRRRSNSWQKNVGEFLNGFFMAGSLVK